MTAGKLFADTNVGLLPVVGFIILGLLPRPREFCVMRKGPLVGACVKQQVKEPPFLWRMLSPGNALSPPLWVFSPDGVGVLKGKSLAEAFNTHFAAVYSSPEGSRCGHAVGSGPTHALQPSLELPFSMLEFESVLAKCSNGAPGVYGVKYENIRTLDRAGRQELLDLYNAVWDGAEVPQAWKIAVLSPLIKAGRDKHQLLGYRPVALTSCVGKIYERLLVSRLSWFVERVDGFHPAQFGFRSGRSAQDAILLLESGVRETWLAGGVVLAVFLDIKAAYDTVVNEWVLAEMEELGVSLRLINAIAALLHERVFVSRANGVYSSPKTTSRGLPQGSCLSPILFALLLNSLLRQVAPASNVAAFADDVGLWLGGPDLGEIQVAMQRVVDMVEGWLNVRGMGLSPGKSQCVVFSRVGHQRAVLTIGGQVVESVEEVCYLGVKLDSQLTWRSEVAAVRERISRSSAVLLGMVGRAVTYKRSILRNFFRSFIQSRADYHLPFLAGSRSMLNRVQVEVNKCLRIITGCLQSTSVPALQVEAGVTPLFLRAQGLLVRLTWRCLGRGESDLVGKILKDYLTLGPTALRALGTGGLGASLVRGPPFHRFQVCVPVSSMAPWVWATELVEAIQPVSCQSGWQRARVKGVGTDALHVFCDASFDHATWHGGVGVAVPDLKLEYAWKLAAVPSAVLAELVAISLAIDTGIDLRVEQLTILSDSQVAIKFLAECLGHLVFSYPIALEIGLKLFRARQCGVVISVEWVPGHAGVFGNEEADRLARAACYSLAGNWEEVTVPYAVAQLKSVVSAWEKGKWGEEWCGGEKGRDLFELHPSVSCPRELDLLPRRDAVLLSRLRTGHIGLVGQVFDLALQPTPSCRCGHPLVTVRHLLLSCPALVHHRNLLETAARGQTLSLPVLLGLCPHAPKRRFTMLRAVLRFCRLSGLFE